MAHLLFICLFKDFSGSSHCCNKKEINHYFVTSIVLTLFYFYVINLKLLTFTLLFFKCFVNLQTISIKNEGSLSSKNCYVHKCLTSPTELLNSNSMPHHYFGSKYTTTHHHGRETALGSAEFLMIFAFHLKLYRSIQQTL